MDKKSLKVGTFLNLFGTYKNCPMWHTFILLTLSLVFLPNESQIKVILYGTCRSLL